MQNGVVAAPGRSIGPMSEPLSITIIAVLALALVRLLLIHLRYRLSFRFDEDDLREARSDAARRSRSALSGRAAEQLAPVLRPFADSFDPADARFLGAPVDFVVFDGSAAGELGEVVFVEVKSGRSSLSASERQVRDAIDEGRVRYEVIRPG